MNINEIIKKYNIRIGGDGTQLACNKSIGKNAEALAFVKSHKQDIIDYIKAEAKAANKANVERTEKIAAIEGLSELKNAISDHENYKEEFDSFILSGAIGKAPIKPSSDIQAIKSAYPRAAAYLYAQEFSRADHHIKANAGREALDKIINGVPFEEVIFDMENKWNDYCKEHAMD